MTALDENGYRYWGKRVAVQKAVDNTSMGDIVYIRIENPAGMLLGGLGDAPAWAVDNISSPGKVGVSSRKINFNNGDLQEIILPFLIDGQVEGVARVALNRDKMDQILSENRFHMIISMALIVLTGLMAIWFLFQNQNRHLARMEELGKRLQQSERLSSLGQLAAGVAHEIRNPLNAISLAVQRIQREFAPAESRADDFKKITSVIRDEVRRLNGIIEEFLAFSRTQRLDLKDFPVEDILRKLLGLMEEEAGLRGIKIIADFSSTPSIVPMDLDKLQQAILNILKNAIESISGAGSITVSVENNAKDVSIKVRDTGAGLSPQEIEKIFNPDYTTKEKGLGLGLPIAYEIIRSHGGQINVFSKPGAGTTFEVLLPHA